MLLATGAILAGFITLMWSADKFVNGAAATARNFGMSPMLIGLTIVSIGTSAPEILVSLMAAMSGYGSLAVGNAVGSNIANIGLVLGITAIVAPLPVKSDVVRREIPLLMIITVLAGLLLIDNQLGHLDGILLISGLILTLYLIYRWQRQPDSNLQTTAGAETEEELPDISQAKATVLLIVGLLVMVASSRLLVWGATEVARALGISELIIGLTIVAIGTSLPELAASVVSALKKHHDIALGNIVGSNIFNLLAVMAVPGIVAPATIDPAAFQRDVPAMIAITALLLILALAGRKRQRIGRGAGVLLAACYLGYTLLLYLQS
ncbi:calcium/sodium antiporter [Kistimonas scapharcae]|uniref:Calcium/sodium antiporter n=1 Tax=Kistimonas scapharcae TaxID=1036133 RepID=A0ABP8UW07_9GAMM